MNRICKVVRMHTEPTSSKGRSATIPEIGTDPGNGDESTRKGVEEAGKYGMLTLGYPYVIVCDEREKTS